MGLAERKAEEIKRIRDQQSSLREWHRERIQIVRSHAPSLFDSLAECITDEVDRFSKLEKSAQGLRVNRSDENHLQVESDRFPKIKLNVSNDSTTNTLTAEFDEYHSGLWPKTRPKPIRFKFSADERLEPCFTDGRTEFHPQEVAEILLEKVFSFFGYVQSD
jgi:hypothetical protein